jgi:hypothetical protein
MEVASAGTVWVEAGPQAGLNPCRASNPERDSSLGIRIRARTHY